MPIGKRYFIKRSSGTRTGRYHHHHHHQQQLVWQPKGRFIHWSSSSTHTQPRTHTTVMPRLHQRNTAQHVARNMLLEARCCEQYATCCAQLVACCPQHVARPRNMLRGCKRGLKPGFHYPSSWPEFTGRVDGPWTRVHFLTPELTARVDGCQKCTRVDGPWTRPVNSGHELG